MTRLVVFISVIGVKEKAGTCHSVNTILYVGGGYEVVPAPYPTLPHPTPPNTPYIYNLLIYINFIFIKTIDIKLRILILIYYIFIFKKN